MSRIQRMAMQLIAEELHSKIIIVQHRVAGNVVPSADDIKLMRAMSEVLVEHLQEAAKEA